MMRSRISTDLRPQRRGEGRRVFSVSELVAKAKQPRRPRPVYRPGSGHRSPGLPKVPPRRHATPRPASVRRGSAHRGSGRPGSARSGSAHRPISLLVSDYAIVKSLRKGGLSLGVFVVKKQSTGKVFVAKQVSATRKTRKRANAELKVLKRIPQGHNTLNWMQEYIWGHRQLTFILEYCDRENLHVSHMSLIRVKTFAEDGLMVTDMG